MAAFEFAMLARVHALLGIVPLGAYLAYHLYQTWPVLHDRELWVERALDAPPRAAIALWVFVPLVVHGTLGIARMLRTADSALNGPPGLRRLQAVTGVLALGFVVYHVLQVWAVSAGPHASPRDAYAILWRELGRPLDAAIYVAGVTALCFHVAHGVSRAAVSFAVARSPAGVRAARYAAGALGVALWVALLQLFGHFAVGESLIHFGGS